jgi:hypothetical protein
VFDEFFRSHRGESQLPIAVGVGSMRWLARKGNDGPRPWFGEWNAVIQLAEYCFHELCGMQTIGLAMERKLFLSMFVVDAW